MELAQVEALDVAEAHVVRVTGEIDLSNARTVMEQIGESVRSGASVVLVDLSALSFLDSSGIGMLFRLARRLGYSRQELRLVVPPGSHVRRVLEMTRVADVIPILDAAGQDG